MDLRVPALQKWSKISPARAASTEVDMVRTRETGLGLLPSWSLSSAGLSELCARRRVTAALAISAPQLLPAPHMAPDVSPSEILHFTFGATGRVDGASPTKGPVLMLLI